MLQPNKRKPANTLMPDPSLDGPQNQLGQAKSFGVTSGAIIGSGPAMRPANNLLARTGSASAVGPNRNSAAISANAQDVIGSTAIKRRMARLNTAKP